LKKALRLSAEGFFCYGRFLPRLFLGITGREQGKTKEGQDEAGGKMTRPCFISYIDEQTEGRTVMNKKAAAFAAALTLSAVVAAPVFAEDSSMYGTGMSTGTATGGTSPTATSTPGIGMMNWGATASPHTYSGTTGVNNYGTTGTNDMTGTSGTGGIFGGAGADGSYTGYGTGTGYGMGHDGTGTYGTNSYNALATDDDNMDWGWLGLLGLLGLAGLRGRNRDSDRSAIK
jgi:hypothetical protein